MPPGAAAAEQAGSATIATRRALAAIEALNSEIRAMLTVRADQALATAAALDRAEAAGAWQGLLHGVPIALKDNIDLADTLTTAASPLLAGNVAARDAFIVERMKRAGAVIIGKANMHEWAIGPTGYSQQVDPCVNYWNPNHIAGGSSSGSAAAVAAGMCLGAIGSDTGGSVRIPAALNGVVGLRPTIGLVSNRGSLPVSPALDTLGPMALRVVDVARILTVIAGHDPEDPLSADVGAPNYLADIDAPVAGLRLGVPRTWFYDALAPEMASAVEAAIEVFRGMGVSIVPLDLQDGERSQSLIAFALVLADAYEVHRARLAEHRDSFGADLLARLDIGAGATAADYAQAMRWMEGWRHRLRAAFQAVDAILTPTTPGPAPSIADSREYLDKVRELTRNTYAWAAWGGPTLSVPCGFSADRLPLGMQITGRWFDEAVILRLGQAYQEQKSKP